MTVRRSRWSRLSLSPEMSSEFAKCAHCGTWHVVGLVEWGGVLIKTCPHIPTVMIAKAIIRDPDEDNPISATYRGPAQPD